METGLADTDFDMHLAHQDPSGWDETLDSRAPYHLPSEPNRHLGWQGRTPTLRRQAHQVTLDLPEDTYPSTDFLWRQYDTGYDLQLAEAPDEEKDATTLALFGWGENPNSPDFTSAWMAARLRQDMAARRRTAGGGIGEKPRQRYVEAFPLGLGTPGFKDHVDRLGGINLTEDLDYMAESVKALIDADVLRGRITILTHSLGELRGQVAVREILRRQNDIRGKLEAFVAIAGAPGSWNDFMSVRGIKATAPHLLKTAAHKFNQHGSLLLPDDEIHRLMLNTASHGDGYIRQATPGSLSTFFDLALPTSSSQLPALTEEFGVDALNAIRWNRVEMADDRLLAPSRLKPNDRLREKLELKPENRLPDLKGFAHAIPPRLTVAQHATIEGMMKQLEM